MELTVAGMFCEGCKVAIERVVRRVPGVEAAEVDLATGRLIVRGNPERQAVVRAVMRAGYRTA